jgi:acetylornithine/succinyldiaminopimelate/putrescine aminotransferase
LACAASLAVQNVIEQENLLENIRKQGAYLGKPSPFSNPYCFLTKSCREITAATPYGTK